MSADVVLPAENEEKSIAVAPSAVHTAEAR
jgi:hypothetical protein